MRVHACVCRRLLERYQLQEKQISKEVAMDMEPDDILTPDEKRQAEDVKKGIARCVCVCVCMCE